MIEAWQGFFNLILFLVSMFGLGYYSYLSVLSPNTIVTRYDLGEKSTPIIRIVGTFVLPLFIMGIWIILRGTPESCWIFFVYNFLVSLGQVIVGWATRLKLIDPDSKTDVSDEVIGHVFLFIAVILIYRLSETIYV